ncbi:MAG: 1-deoxy-D-xylulose-5-phosphate reductoisomerase [Boseongicola sp. SB0677_bin_26]|nr:1-deoxy-D-xylulose-5-phosphate reductoisomerase [Boseongicola sp. SB0665_bin_10]MYG24411.1 1-deoxy-D-xylulose-5-phosphate reductoisomerase [Boseongicola sp. SB0677_bin_26]
MTRRISILGATGSIGANTLGIIRQEPEAYRIVALTGGRNIKSLASAATEFNAEIAVTACDDLLGSLRDALRGTGVEAAAGEQALIDAAARPADWAMSAIVGFAGLPPGLRALEQGTTLALANKESLVAAGPLLIETARRNGASILPVDSEHSAIFQALNGENLQAVERVIITASGGAFRDWPLEALSRATPEQAASHPNWPMGQRITIDSASMFNKALELIEAKEFFGFSSEQIEVLIHRESLVHALVGFRDGGLMAHVGPPDMRHAIGYALHYPERPHLPVERLDLAGIGQLHFQAPEPGRYPALVLVREVMAAGGHAGAAFNGAKEAALDGFLEGRIRFTDMARVVEREIENISVDDHAGSTMTLGSVRESDRAARARAWETMDALDG